MTLLRFGVYYASQEIIPMLKYSNQTFRQKSDTIYNGETL